MPKRIYRRCLFCDFIGLDESFLLSSEEELAVYARHENSIDDPRYVAFFERFINEAIRQHIDQPSVRCLDFGSGPEPVLATLLEQRFNWSVDIYDKFYQPEKVYEGKNYDLITATEVVEHLVEPMEYFRLFKNLLRPGGIITLMTLFHANDEDDFKRWFYTNDPSHVSFYTPRTMTVIARQLGLKILYCDDYRHITLAHACPP